MNISNGCDGFPMVGYPFLVDSVESIVEGLSILGRRIADLVDVADVQISVIDNVTSFGHSSGMEKDIMGGDAGRRGGLRVSLGFTVGTLSRRFKITKDYWPE